MGLLDGKSIVFFAEEMYEDLELWYPKIRLTEEGARTVVAAPEARVYRGKNGYPVKADISLNDVRVNEYDALIIPGGYAPDKLRRYTKTLEITRQMFDEHKVVAFICHAGWVPISARILKGKKATSVRAIKDDMENAGALWEDKSVVVDGNLISSRTPEDLPDFCKAIIKALAGD
ncbi:MAG: type 1 glutamine amidotransferase [Ignavibacteriae bacterium]|nr:type 1 glutamine amidotransferase [Ignavibacteriota bacterium]